VHNTFAVGRVFGIFVLLVGLTPALASADELNLLSFFFPSAQANDHPPENLFKSKRVTSSTICQIIVTQVLGGARACSMENAREPGSFRVRVDRDKDNMLLFHVVLLFRIGVIPQKTPDGTALFELFDLDMIIDRTKSGTIKTTATVADGLFNPVQEDGLWNRNNSNNSPIAQKNYAEVSDALESGMSEVLTGVIENCPSISGQQDLSLALQSCLLTSQP